ncbi:hypothetical protein QYE76_024287 [Lolium multiflorum]|uniref:F-box domain-containing protein n=1 Tax=Lolium multiflorum TaxID=4521 RepID=A0AAD8VVK6_LOLMU|nr:hypothetical protein QYE76_024287 [Lolium multiflorum]
MNNISRRALHGIYLRTRRSPNIRAMQNAAARCDRLSELPNNILLDILERVDTLDALRTCTLSKRLMRLPAMLSRFDIDICSLTQHHDKASHGFNTADVVRYNNTLAGVTEKILAARSPEIHTIHKLRVTCYLRPDECLPITRAFASTMADHKVDKAEFVPILEKPFSECTNGDLLCYAKRFNICLGDCPAAFAGLTCLWLSNLRFADQLDIPNILSTCKRLESLRLSHCDAGIGSVLMVEHDQLVELIVDQGVFAAVHLYGVPKLQHLTFNCWWYQAPLTFGCVPQLSKLSLGKRGRTLTRNLQLSQLLANVPSIRDMHLDFVSEKIWVVPECPKVLTPVLRKLEILNLDNIPEGFDIAWTMFILEAASSLRELCIMVWDHYWCKLVIQQGDPRKQGYPEKANGGKWQTSAGFKHKNLLKLTIYGFQPNENMVQYVRRIREVAVNMREISLHDVKEACERCGDLDPKTKVITRSKVYPNNLIVRRMISLRSS